MKSFGRLDRFVIREVAPPALMGLLVYTFLLMMRPIFALVEMVLVRGVRLGSRLEGPREHHSTCPGFDDSHEFSLRRPHRRRPNELGQRDHRDAGRRNPLHPTAQTDHHHRDLPGPSQRLDVPDGDSPIQSKPQGDEGRDLRQCQEHRSDRSRGLLRGIPESSALCP